MSETKHILMDLLDDPSFHRWIKGKASRTEQKKWEQWLAGDQLHQEIKRKADILCSLPYEETLGSDMHLELSQLQERLNDGRSTNYGIPTSTRKSNKGYYWAVAAAVTLLIIAVSVITFYTEQQSQKKETQPLFSTIEVGYGEKGSLKISDGSTIRLNANSTLLYSPEQFNRSHVEVWLKGEAYFSIVRNPDGEKRNFVVHTPDGDIRILGTRFNVNTRFDRTDVVLEEGSIEVLLNDTASGVAGQFKLKPGQRARFSSRKADVQVQKVDTSAYTAWLDGQLVFKEAPLKNVLENVEQTYGVKFEVNDPDLLEEKISGSLRNPDLSTLLVGLEKVLNLKISQQSKKYYLIETGKIKSINELSKDHDK